MHVLRAIRRSIVLFAAIAAMSLEAGCNIGGSSPARSASSGSPEADRRADLLVDDDGVSSQTLYERLGGTPGIRAIVDDMTARVLDDPRVNFHRKNVDSGWLGTNYDSWEASPRNVERFKTHLVDFIELASGGPSQYDGRSMEESHEGMRISNVEFDAFIGDLKASMVKLNVDAAEQRDLLAIFETTRKQIVEKRE